MTLYTNKYYGPNDSIIIEQIKKKIMNNYCVETNINIKTSSNVQHKLVI